jgi:hypothetical protein
MDAIAETLIRAGAVIVFGVVFVAFVYLVTQRTPRKDRREEEWK